MKKLSITLEEKQLKEIMKLSKDIHETSDAALEHFDVRDKLKRDIKEYFDKLESVVLEM